MRAAGLAFLVVAVWSCPRICQAADPIRVHPSVSVGGGLWTATEEAECSASGAFECSLPAKRERGFGLQAAPYLEALVMVGRDVGFRFGVGVRYVPGFALDTGSELHFAIVPEMIGELSRGRYLFGHLFNSVVVGYPPSTIRERQRPTLDSCSSLQGVEGAHCSSSYSKVFLSLGLEVGLLERWKGAGLRYGIGFQAPYEQNWAHAHGYSGDDADRSKDSLYVTYLTQSGRALAFVGVEW